MVIGCGGRWSRSMAGLVVVMVLVLGVLVATGMVIGVGGCV